MLLIKRAKAPIRLMLSAVALSCWVFSAHAQNNPVAESASYASLKSIFDAAWQRQPEARALQARRDAAQAQAKAAHLLSPEAPTLEVRQRTDQMTGNYGAREAEVGLAIPLWLPGQRTASAELAQA